MECNKYEKHQFGEYPEDLFTEHLKECTSCKMKLDMDNKIAYEAAKIKSIKIEDEGLWGKIETQLKKEKKRKTLQRPYVMIAATLLLGIIAAPIYFVKEPLEPTGLFDEKSLNKVLQTEASYIKAIGELEKQVIPSMHQMKPELALSFRDRLETIDQQIEACQKELENNPANIHIRKYLMAALSEKRQTLHRIIENISKKKSLSS